MSDFSPERAPSTCPFSPFRNLELVKGSNQVLHAFISVGLADIQAGVCSLHVTTGVLAGTATGNAPEIDHVLADASLGVVAQADKEPAQLGIARQPGEELIGDLGQGVVSAQALIQ